MSPGHKKISVMIVFFLPISFFHVIWLWRGYNRVMIVFLFYPSHSSMLVISFYLIFFPSMLNISFYLIFFPLSYVKKCFCYHNCSCYHNVGDFILFDMFFSVGLEFGFLFTSHNFFPSCFGFLSFLSIKIMFKFLPLIINQPSTKKGLIKKLPFNNIIMLKKFTYLL